MPYEYFDMIVCITLKENVERQQSFVKQMQIAGITNYEFFRVDRHPEGGKKGCFDSHVRVWEYALSRGMGKILVFEDDTVVTPAYSVDVVTL
jgi:GR25 family glycosyltransferase involved in LPS biosynthesis